MYISGAAELVLGDGFILPSLRKVTGLGSAIFLICGYPANIYMWIYDLELGDGKLTYCGGSLYPLASPGFWGST